MPAGPTAPRVPARPATSREDARQLAPGSTRPATCGCSAGRALAQPATATSTICGDLYGRSDKNTLAAQRAVKSVREAGSSLLVIPAWASGLRFEFGVPLLIRRNAMCPRASRALITLV